MWDILRLPRQRIHATQQFDEEDEMILRMKSIIYI